MKQIALADVKNSFPKYLRMAEKEDIIITRHGKSAGILIGFQSEEDWFDYRLEHDPRFLKRMAAARQSLQLGQGIRIEELEE